MANHPSAAKRNRQRVKRTAANKDQRSALRTSVKKARSAVAAGEPDAAAKVKAAEVALARAASKGLIHRNAARRTTARVASAASRRSAG